MHFHFTLLALGLVIVGAVFAYLGRVVCDPTWTQFARKRDMALAGSFFVSGGSAVVAGVGSVFLL